MTPLRLQMIEDMKSAGCLLTMLNDAGHRDAPAASLLGAPERGRSIRSEGRPFVTALRRFVSAARGVRAANAWQREQRTQR